ncbi:hypothetical protein ABK040_002779 [Willaertia magna]
MACFKEKTVDEQKDEKIAKKLVESHQKQQQEIKLLLLGAGESGKSTIFKQMKIIHHKGYTQEECTRFKDVIYGNTLQSIRVLIESMRNLGITFESSEAEEYADKLQKIPEQQIILGAASLITPQLGQEIKKVWNDGGIQKVYARRSEFQLNDSAAYYLNDIDRLSGSNYQPTQQDVLRSRVKTVGIVEADFIIDDYKFKMIDVGGQRNERRKWIHVFDDVTSIVFVTSLSEYDQKLFEDKTMNRMHESLTLFTEICNSRYFKNTSIVIFFNKKDIFADKIKEKDLKMCFPEYTGGCNYNAALDFITEQFLQRGKTSAKRNIYTHVTCATDTENVKVVFNAVKNVILQKNLEMVNML